MGIIKVLHPNTVNQIAAGEVVERPSSIVKELVENAVDAHATSVTVEIANGGIDCIRVTDNGVGILPEDCALVFEPHATSKIHTAQDLSHIETLGFRGEALASIASVAQVSLRTRAQDQEVGTWLQVDGGQNVRNQPIGCPEGTTVEVRNLFYHVPARLKFLKSPRTEAGYIGEYVSRMILAHPEISFHYVNNEKTIYHSTGDGTLEHAILCIYGSGTLAHLRSVAYDDGYLAISGYIGMPELARPNRLSQSFFVNGRYIRSALLSGALDRAYDTRLMGGKFAFAVLNFRISSNEVDVNVHPNKLAVRFVDENRIQQTVTDACIKALGPAIPTSVTLNTPEPMDPAPIVSTQQQTHALNAEPVPIKAYDANDSEAFSMLKGIKTTPGEAQRVREASGNLPPMHMLVPLAAKQEPHPKAETVEQEAFGVAPYTVVGNVFDTYWIIQQEERILIIDQHAVHERKLYEQFLSQEEPCASQPLLMPIIMKLNANEYQILSDEMDTLTQMGFAMDDFGTLTVRIDAVPIWLDAAKCVEAVHEIIHDLMRQGKTSTRALRREALIQSACKHAVKAGESLDKTEIESLLESFRHSGAPMTCPHGRPIMIQLSKRELEKLFKRVL